MLLMVEKWIRSGICHAIHRYAKANNKYIKDYDKNKEPSYLSYWDVNNLYGWAMSQKLPGNNFEWIEETSQFNETITKRVIKDFFLSFLQYLKKIQELHMDLPFLSERMELGKIKSL